MDFYDKLVISITFVILTFIFVFNTFCFADIEISGTRLDGFGGYQTIHPVSGIYGIYFYIPEPGKYIVVSDVQSTVGSYRTDEIPSNGVATIPQPSLTLTSSSQNKTFIVNEPGYYLFYSSDNEYSISSISITRDSSFNYVISSLSEQVGISNIWNIFEYSIPYVSVVLLAGFGFYLIFHNIKELSKGRENMN